MSVWTRSFGLIFILGCFLFWWNKTASPKEAVLFHLLLRGPSMHGWGVSYSSCCFRSFPGHQGRGGSRLQVTHVCVCVCVPTVSVQVAVPTHTSFSGIPWRLFTASPPHPAPRQERPRHLPEGSRLATCKALRDFLPKKKKLSGAKMFPIRRWMGRVAGALVLARSCRRPPVWWQPQS